MSGLVKSTLSRDIDRLLESAGGFDAARSLILEHLKNEYQTRFSEISDHIFKSPDTAYLQRHEIAKLTDDIVDVVFEIAYKRQFQNKTPSASDTVSLIAVGGYGRFEMAPYSDVDILFLIPNKLTPNFEAVIGTFLYLMWDLGFKIGQSTRSVDECLALAKEDITIRTSLLEQRFLAGDHAQFDDLSNKLRSYFEQSIPEFIEAKMEEREKRHDKSGNIRYVLEPNVKEAKGGLRDLQTLYWLGKYITGADTPEGLQREGLFQVEELASFCEAENFLWNVRMILHMISKRGNDFLSFDTQVDVAEVLGFQDGDGQRGVEKFMQAYFRQARQVGELTRVFLTELESRHVWRSFLGIGDMIRSNIATPKGLRTDHGRINFEDDDVLLDDPINLFRLFEVALSSGRLIHPNAFRLMAAHHEIIDDNFCESQEANRVFMSMLLDYGNPERVLRRMNELGLLSEFIPDWAKIDAMMQYNMYHSYTVDEHTIQCISILSDIEKGSLSEELPIASSILEKGVNRRVLYLALLFHDIGKGQERPHEIVGEEIALRAVRRFGLNDAEVELVAWLVRQHLEMSDAAQKRDLSDPKTIQDFAELVCNQERLDLLTVLTVCDIRGVGPTTWNNWKATLLRELYALTKETLQEDGAVSGLDAREVEAKNALRDAIGDWSVAAITLELDRHYSDYWLGLPTDVHVEFAELLANEQDEGVARVSFSQDVERDATRTVFAMPDHPGLFARICGAVSLSGANIVDARTYTSSDGMATAVFWLQNNDGGCYAPSRQVVLEQNVRKVLNGEVLAREALAERAKIKKREREFTVDTNVTFDNDGSRIYTIIEIETRDRKGLLFDITRALAGANISISSAIVATYGEEAVDSFYVKDLFGLKIYSESKQRSIEAKLKDAIERGYQEAMR